MKYVLVSACLLGQPVRYDGRSVPSQSSVLTKWLAAGSIIAICPEVEGGLPTPRAPAEIEPSATAQHVLAGHAHIINNVGNDVTMHFVQGANAALALALQYGIQVAVLKEGSPSCGSGYIYDGHFNGQRLAGMGVTAQLLKNAGLHVFSEKQMDLAEQCLNLIK